MKKLLSLIHIVIPLILGGLIYVCFRSNSIVLFKWIDFIGMSELVTETRNIASPLRTLLPDWMIYSLPDGLWVYSWTAFMLLLWKEETPSGIGRAWRYTGLLFGIGLELFQLLKLVPGSFDLIDVVLCFICYVAAVALADRNVAIKRPWLEFYRSQEAV